MSSPVDAAVAAVAVPQCGAFSLRQLLACGGSYQLARRRVASGVWLAGPRSILQLPGFPASFRQRLWWAILLAPEGSYVSHWSAVALHDVVGFPPVRLTITVPHGRHHVSPVAVVYQTRAPAVPELIGGLPVSPLTRALVDCGRLVGARRLGAAVDDADGDGKITIPKFQKEALALAASGRNGISTVHRVLEVRVEQGYVPPRATLERYLDRVLDRLPVHFEKEAPLPGRGWSRERVDRLCRHPKPFVIEGDGRRYHTRIKDFGRDARRRRLAAGAGFPTLNYLYEELRDDPDAIEAELLTILGLRSGE
jgi:hypothetical protein